MTAESELPGAEPCPGFHHGIGDHSGPLVEPAYEADAALEALRSGPSELDGEAFDWSDRSRPYRHPHYCGV